MADWFDDLGNQYDQSLRPNLDPLILDLNNDGIVLKSRADAGVWFDMDNDGVREQTGWLTADDGFLAIDENNNGIIDNVGELIGDPGRSGFQELKTYDSNNDNLIDASDAIWSRLRIWRDLDADGVTDAGELQSLAANGVISLDTRFTTVTFTAAENLIHEQGFYTTTGGVQRRLIDAWLQTDSVNTKPIGTTPASAAAAALPNMRGYGTLKDLHGAMTADATLLGLVRDFAGLTPDRFDEVEGRVEAIMMRWAAASALDPASRGGAFDARKLAVLEAVTGTPWVQQGTNPPVTNPPSWVAGNLQNAYNILIDQFTARFLAVGPLADVLESVLYSRATDRILPLASLDDYIGKISEAAPEDGADAVFYWKEAIKLLRDLGASTGLQSSETNQKIVAGLAGTGLENLVDLFETRLFDNRSDTTGAEWTSVNRDIVLFGSAADTIILTRGGAAFGGAGNDGIFGSDRDDLLDGEAGIDWLEGRRGNDTYVIDNPSDAIIEDNNSSGGVDTVRASFTYTLAAGLEYLVLTGAANIDGTGNASNNLLVGNAGRNVLRGLGGDDIYEIGVGDTVIEELNGGSDQVRIAASFTLPNNVELLTLLGTGDFRGTGNALANAIYGNDGANTLDGGEGTDRLYGGLGNDVYLIGDGDNVYDVDNDGVDHIFSTANSTYLPSHVENLTLVGPLAVLGYGNQLANRVTGSDGANRLTGGGGVDTLEGRGGDDVYILDDAVDIIIEAANSGRDRIETTHTQVTLVENVEELIYTGYNTPVNYTGNVLANLIEGSGLADTLSGGDGHDTLKGGNGADTLSGGNGNDRLEGGAGGDSMVGGGGDDYYIINDATDVAVEAANGGNDTIEIYTSVFAPPANVENIILGGFSNIDVNGTALGNLIVGNDAANVIDGAGGADTMRGRGGDDVYSVDIAGDRIMEDAGDGTDTVNSFVSFVLGPNLEKLNLLGTTAIHATGNASNNVIIGNAANNVLVGGRGYDTLTGGAGRDTFRVIGYDDTYDTITDFQLGTNGDTLDLTKLLASVGYSGSDPLADGLIRIENYSTNASVSVQINRNWGTTLGQNWNYVAFVQAAGITADGFRTGGQMTFNSTGNMAPMVVNAPAPITLMHDESLRLRLGTDVAADFDSDVLMSSAAIVSSSGLQPLPSWMSFNTAARALFGLPDENATNITVRFTVRDEKNLSTSFDVPITILGNMAGSGTSIADNAVLSGAADNFAAGSGNDTIYGRGGADTLVGDGGNDVIFGNIGSDQLSGGAGADNLYGGLGADAHDGGTGIAGEIDYARYDDANYGHLRISLLTPSTNTGVAAGDTYIRIEGLVGGVGNDTITGDGNNNALWGMQGNDFVFGGAGNDTLYGREGTDHLYGGLGADAHDGGTGIAGEIDYARYDDANYGHLKISLLTPSTNTGAAAGDTYARIEGVVGGLGDDTITGDANGNWLWGGGGKDVIEGSGGADYLNGGADSDTLSYAGSRTAVNINLNAAIVTGGDATGDTIIGFENVTGSAHNDTLSGDVNANVIRGGNGNDAINAWHGDDFIFGGLGNDTLRGSLGADRFYFDTALNATTNVDTLSDFSIVDDFIMLENAVFTALTTGGALAAARFAVVAAGGDATTAAQNIVYEQSTGRLFYDADGSNAGAKIHFASVTANTALTAGDFWVY